MGGDYTSWSKQTQMYQKMSFQIVYLLVQLAEYLISPDFIMQMWTELTNRSRTMIASYQSGYVRLPHTQATWEERNIMSSQAAWVQG